MNMWLRFEKLFFKLSAEYIYDVTNSDANNFTHCTEWAFFGPNKILYHKVGFLFSVFC